MLEMEYLIVSIINCRENMRLCGLKTKGKGLIPSFMLFINRIIGKVFRMFGMHVMQQTFPSR